MRSRMPPMSRSYCSCVSPEEALASTSFRIDSTLSSASAFIERIFFNFSAEAYSRTKSPWDSKARRFYIWSCTPPKSAGRERSRCRNHPEVYRMQWLSLRKGDNSDGHARVTDVHKNDMTRVLDVWGFRLVMPYPKTAAV